ncbi:hypothetical protein VNI00_008439 [Paramarasmius palmivorus]|uniref:XPG-I domain-containing protein n=1 Tax=Paramarasmius palmivorus TaxID=297713 RepID=A0AAW0CWU7_9AGAR
MSQNSVQPKRCEGVMTHSQIPWYCLVSGFDFYKGSNFMASLHKSKKYPGKGNRKARGATTAPPPTLNAVSTAFAGFHQVVVEYSQPGAKFDQTVQDDLDGEREALVEDQGRRDDEDDGNSEEEDQEDEGGDQASEGGAEPSAKASMRDGDGDTVMAEADGKLNLGIVKEFSKGVSDSTLTGYQSLMNQLEKWVHDHNLIPQDDKFFRPEPHEDTPDMISAWIMDACDTIKLDGTVRPKLEARKSWSHAQKMRASATFGFGRLHGLGTLTWHRSEVSGKMLGNPSVSHQVSQYMVSLHRRKVNAGEEATSARAITSSILCKMYNFNTHPDNWDPAPPKLAQPSSSSVNPNSRTRLKNTGKKKNHLGPRFRRLLHLAYTIAFACLLRVDEVLNITFEQIEVDEDVDGTSLLIITLSQRKTAQFGEILPFILRQLPEHQRHLCPVRAYAEWIDALNEEEGYVFRRMKGDRMGPADQAMTSQQFLEGLRHNLLDVGIDPAPYGTHSFRRGGCQWLSMDLRWPFTKICHWGGWSTELTHSTIIKYLVSWNDEPVCPRKDFFNFEKMSDIRCPMCGRSPLLSSYEANKIALSRKVLHAPVDLTLSQFLWFLLQLTRATVNCIFVFDGMHRPQMKRGTQVVSHQEPAPIDEVKSLILPAGFHYHTAPGEAEAELAELNKRGIIDMIISPDSDLFALGATCIAKVNSKESKELDELVVDVYDVCEINRVMGMNQERFLVYTLLAGNDLDDGIKGCGPLFSLGAAQSLSVPFLSQYQALSDEKRVRDLLEELKVDLIHIFKANPGTLPSKSPAISRTLQSSKFPLYAPLDAFARPLTSWSRNSPATMPDTTKWVPRIPDIRGLAERCHTVIKWHDELLLKKFLHKVYPGVILQMLCSKHVYYDYRDGTLLAARADTPEQRIAAKTMLLNPESILPSRILDPRRVNPQETVGAIFSILPFTSDVLLALGRTHTIQSSAIRLQIPTVLIFAATHPSRYGRLTDQPQVHNRQDLEILSISSSSSSDGRVRSLLAEEEVIDLTAASETSKDGDSVDPDIEFGEVTRAPNFIDLTTI